MFENAEICRRRIRISVVLSIVVAISSLGVGSANADGTMVSSDSTRTLKVAVPTAADEASGVLPPRLTSKVVGVLGSAALRKRVAAYFAVALAGGGLVLWLWP